MTDNADGEYAEVWDYRRGQRTCLIRLPKGDPDATISQNEKILAVSAGPLKDGERNITFYDTVSGDQVFKSITPPQWMFEHWFLSNDLLAVRLTPRTPKEKVIEQIWQLNSDGTVRDVSGENAFADRFTPPLRKVVQPGYVIRDIATHSGRMIECQGNWGMGNLRLYRKDAKSRTCGFSRAR